MVLKKKIMICIAIFLLILVAIFWELGVFRNVEYAVQDRLYQKSKVINHNIYVIGIDEETLDNYGKFSSFSREKIADLVELLNSGDSKPAVIGLDISFFGEEDEFKDHHLAEVLAKQIMLFWYRLLPWAMSQEKDKLFIYMKNLMMNLKIIVIR